MNATELISAVGKKGRISLEDMRFEVEILDARVSYGNTQYLIKPVNGWGERWVSSHRVHIKEEV